jgi:hypothetical protein
MYAERETVVRVQTFLADLRDEKAQCAHEPTLQRIIADEAAGHGDTEERQPEEFEGAKGQRHFGQYRREGGEAQHTEERSAERAGGRDADRTTGLAA